MPEGSEKYIGGSIYEPKKLTPPKPKSMPGEFGPTPTPPFPLTEVDKPESWGYGKMKSRADRSMAQREKIKRREKD